MEPYRPRLGDLLDLVEVTRSAVPVADAAAEGSAGEETAGDIFENVGGLQTISGPTKPGLSGFGVIARGSSRGLQGGAFKRHPQRGAAKGERVEGDITKPILRTCNCHSLARPDMGGGPVTPS
jgi:hypothetical protein